MKRLILGIATATLIASPALAADIYTGHIVDNKDAPTEYSTQTWVGFYAGANIGSTFDDTTSVEIFGFDLGDIEIDNALVAGVQLGYNWHAVSNLVLGIEADIGIQNDELDLGFDSIDVTSYLASIRARLGYSFGHALLYGTGGVAFQGYEDDVADLLSDDPSVGWVIGAGLDYKVSNNVSLGAESLYYNFENDIVDVIDLERDFWVARVRLNYHFN